MAFFNVHLLINSQLILFLFKGMIGIKKENRVFESHKNIFQPKRSIVYNFWMRGVIKLEFIIELCPYVTDLLVINPKQKG